MSLSIHLAFPTLTFVNLVTPTTGAEHELFPQQTGLWSTLAYVMLCLIMLSVVMLNAIMMSVILSIMAPNIQLFWVP
jgi:hypothetical protein